MTRTRTQDLVQDIDVVAPAEAGYYSAFIQAVGLHCTKCSQHYLDKLLGLWSSLLCIVCCKQVSDYYITLHHVMHRVNAY